MAHDGLSQFPRDVHCCTVRGADFFIGHGSFVCKGVCVPRAGYTRELQQLIQTQQQEGQERKSTWQQEQSCWHWHCPASG
jgi:hypothetical protein